MNTRDFMKKFLVALAIFAIPGLAWAASRDTANTLLYNRPSHHLNGAPLDAVTHLGWVVDYRWEATDFHIYTGPNTAGESGGWLLTETAAGSGNAQRVDSDDSAEGGWLKLLTDDGDNDTEILEQVGESWRYRAGKKMWFVTRIKVSDADDGEALFGLAISDTSPIGSLPSDGLFFEKAETATAMDFHARKNGTSSELTSIDPTALADNTAREYAFAVDSDGKVTVYVDGVEAGTVAAGNTNLPDDEDLHVVFAYQTGAAAAKSMSVDGYLVAEEQ
jgi:hypothetical protein